MGRKIIRTSSTFIFFIVLCTICGSSAILAAAIFQDCGLAKIMTTDKFLKLTRAEVDEIEGRLFFVKAQNRGKTDTTLIAMRILGLNSQSQELQNLAKDLLTEANRITPRNKFMTGVDRGEGDNLNYEVAAAMIVTAKGVAHRTKYVTSRLRVEISEGENLSHLDEVNKLIQDLDTKGEQIAEVYFLHTHPQFSPLSYEDALGGHRYFCENLRAQSSKVKVRFFAVAELLSQTMIGEGNTPKITTIPGAAYLMEDLSQVHKMYIVGPNLLTPN